MTWKPAPPDVGDFEGPMAIYVVRGGPLNFPVPVQVFRGATIKPARSEFLTFNFCDRQIRDRLYRNEILLDMYGGFLQGIEWIGPVSLPD